MPTKFHGKTTEDFVDWVRQKLPCKGQCEVPLLKKLQHDIPIEQIIVEVAKAEYVKADDLNQWEISIWNA
jgi:hypothetical protein